MLGFRFLDFGFWDAPTLHEETFLQLMEGGGGVLVFMTDRRPGTLGN